MSTYQMQYINVISTYPLSSYQLQYLNRQTHSGDSAVIQCPGSTQDRTAAAPALVVRSRVAAGRGEGGACRAGGMTDAA